MLPMRVNPQVFRPQPTQQPAGQGGGASISGVEPFFERQHELHVKVEVLPAQGLQHNVLGQPELSSGVSENRHQDQAHRTR